MSSRSMSATLVLAALLVTAGCSSAPAPSAPAPAVSPAPPVGTVAPAPADAAPAPAEPLTREQVIGDWTTSGTDYESLSLRADGTADSYLHDRPFDQGQWRLSGADLEIAWQGNEVERVTVVRRDGGALEVRTADGPMVWHAIEAP